METERNGLRGMGTGYRVPFFPEMLYTVAGNVQGVSGMPRGRQRSHERGNGKGDFYESCETGSG